ncbi:cell division protein FtsA [Alkalihalobacterium elongatum]|uniref:cell division protein FtsA n=1 Tax=Alkalihalobacterium elongatum TaxID=2675466 RepID=UPI001C1F36A3|nr:cell division protein FtsA [Alkalihalobacterium elongatum]
MNTNIDTPIFALDIGTRSVVGLILHQRKGCYEVIDIISKEHKDRAMLDGQIHNVLSVSELILEIKSTLEEKHGKLKKVCVAAAGRSLKTKRAKVELNISGKSIVNLEDVLHLELSAVQQAQYKLANDFNDKESFNYYCVGYSVLDYRLDGEKIGSLLDQSGQTATVEVIATFLPKVVVESLIAALQRSQLELEALTLEPIAAINVLIPQSMRRLNVALVDIGAGTSDIAITDEGTVTAYGMVPFAGDEVTEAVSDHFLLDFPDAELVKRQLSERDEITLTDILGFETTYSRDAVIEAIKGTIKELANAITTQILELNGKSPKAVMLVGGGSMTPRLSKYIAQALHLPDNRVAIRGIDAIKTLASTEGIKEGPELVTPIGIAIAAKENPIEYISISVNDRTIRVFDVKKLTVGDGLLAAGVQISKLYGKPGSAMMIYVNDQLVTIPGTHGEPPKIFKNGQQTTLDALLEANDCITIEKGKNGAPAVATVSDIVEDIPAVNIILNGQAVSVPALLLKNGKQTTGSELLQERDELLVQQPKTVKDILTFLQFTNEVVSLTPFFVYVDNRKILLSQGHSLTLNNIEVNLESTIKNGDNLHVNLVDRPFPAVTDLRKELKTPTEQSITVQYNGTPVQLIKPFVEIKRNGKPLEGQTPLINGENLTMTVLNTEPFIFQDLFRFVDVNISPQPDERILVLRNDKDASFSEPIYSGDKLEIRVVSVKTVNN